MTGDNIASGSPGNNSTATTAIVAAVCGTVGVLLLILLALFVRRRMKRSEPGHEALELETNSMVNTIRTHIPTPHIHNMPCT